MLIHMMRITALLLLVILRIDFRLCSAVLVSPGHRIQDYQSVELRPPTQSQAGHIYLGLSSPLRTDRVATFLLFDHPNRLSIICLSAKEYKNVQ